MDLVCSNNVVNTTVVKRRSAAKCVVVLVDVLWLCIMRRDEYSVTVQEFCI